jgi:hypothetical protein
MAQRRARKQAADHIRSRLLTRAVLYHSRMVRTKRIGITRDVEKLTGAESVLRTVASGTSVSNLLQEPRSLPPAALIRRRNVRLTYQCRSNN